MSKKIDQTKKPPTTVVSNLQFDLFTSFLSNNNGEGVSNTVELWESIPKYFFTPAQVSKLRTKDGHADPAKWTYRFKDINFDVKIQPALIEEKDGKYLAYFPGITEEIVEEALKKIFTYQNHGMHDPVNHESWVKFSLSMIHKELKLMGKSRSRQQIKHALDVMSSCIITLYQEGKEVWKGAILQDLTTVNRKEYLENTDAKHVARLPLFISSGIDRLDYRQFNYSRLMNCDEQLSRWIYKQMIHKFIQASMLNTYHFLLSTIARDSGLLQQGTYSKQRQKIISALKELQENGVILDFEEEQKKDGRKVIDVKFTLKPGQSFIQEQKAANKRKKLAFEQASIKEISYEQ